MANKNFKDYAIAGNNITLTYDDVNDTVTFDAQGNVQSVNSKTGAVILDKTDIGLGNVDNTSDVNKPISNATQTALNGKQNSLGFTPEDVANKSTTLDTDKLSNSKYPSVKSVYDWATGLFATITQLGTKQDTLVSGTNIKTVNSNTLLGSGNVVIDKTSVGLGNVANVDTTNASNISSGTLGDARLSTNVTTQGNTFNAASKLVQLDATAKLPAVDGSQLTNLPTFSAPNGLLRLTSAISTTLQTVTDYLANASVLQLNSRRVGLLSDSSVTTQTSSVIQASTTNSNLVLSPNGTGAIVASIPDGTATGGNARGSYAVDLQLQRSSASNVASGNYSFISGFWNSAPGLYSVALGSSNSSTNEASIAIGQGNSASGYRSIAIGTSNTASSNYCVVSGGQSNAASTNTHATVVGGYNNIASGQYSVAGGFTNTASAARSIAIGDTCQSTVTWGIALGRNNTVTGGDSGVALGYGSNVSSYQGMAICAGGKSYIDTQFSQGGVAFSTNGDSQSSIIIARNSTWSGSRLDFTTGQTALLYAANSVTGPIIPSGTNRAWNVQINTIAIVTAITGTATGVSVGDTYSEVKNLLFKKVGGTSSIVGTVDTSNIKSNTSMSMVAITITAGASQEMAITFTAPTFAGGGSVTCRVVSKVSLVEVSY